MGKAVHLSAAIYRGGSNNQLALLWRPYWGAPRGVDKPSGGVKDLGKPDATAAMNDCFVNIFYH